MINLYDMRGVIRNQNSDVTIGSLWSNIYQLSWPMFLIMVLNFFVGLTDIYVAGLISPEVQAAVGFVGQLYFLTIIVANAISIGSLALVSRAIGAGDTAKAVETVRQSLIFSFIVAVLLTAAGFFFYREIIAASGFPLRIRELSEHFFRIFALSLGPNYILIVANAIFRASGEVKKPLLTMLLVSCINIVGDFVLVFGAFTFPGMGYTGIAVSTTVSMAAGMMITLGFFRYGRWKTLYSGPWTIVADAIKKIVRLGWPAAMLQIAWNAGSIVLYTILGRLGEESAHGLGRNYKRSQDRGDHLPSRVRAQHGCISPHRTKFGGAQCRKGRKIRVEHCLNRGRTDEFHGRYHLSLGEKSRLRADNKCSGSRRDYAVS